ncbi:MAG: EAL domain-containing protein [Ruminococcus sp.]|nr:EAL domain-containing protein [Ruminococcus sp.]
MYRRCIELLNEFLTKAEKLSNVGDLDCLISEYYEKLGDTGETPEINTLMDKLCRVTQRLIDLRSDTEAVQKLSELSFEERIELEQVERIIDGNLLCYHFQPIVSAVDGSVFSYEALMRPIGSPLITPFHILKYADLTDRLRDIERATFLNVLGLLDKDPDMFYGRPVFINSIPNITLPKADSDRISALLVKYSDKAVIEMTESGELDEHRYRILKEEYRSNNVRIAIDDYGTGYSNIKNLLDYMPNFVKIDRSLLSEIQNSQKKRHFVRETIDFCHDNGILALAEGVETSEELRAVILLGVDLIQGYYTARPSPEVIESIDEDIAAEIRRCRAELRDGIASKQYVAADGERIMLDALVRDGYSSVLIGKDLPEGARVTVAGTPSNETAISVYASRLFKGTIAIDNVSLLSIREAPCIELLSNSDVTVEIIGENRLNGGGIRVPHDARLNVTGNGALTIKIDNSDYYGIGDDLASKNGEIVFAHDSMLTIDANGQRGVGIGSGMGGGKIIIKSGKYLISQQGGYGVCIGTFADHAELDIHDCDLETKLSTAKGTALGSLYSSTDIHLWRSSYRCFAGGLTMVGIGSPDGDYSKVTIDNANISIDVRGDECTAVGSLNGLSDISVSKASFRVNAGGNNALVFGSRDNKTRLSVVNADVGVELATENESFTSAAKEDMIIQGGRCLFSINGVERSI